MAPADYGPHDGAALLASIVESTDDAIISTDLNGILTFWNAAAERLYGYSASEAVGQPIELIIPADRLEEERGLLRRIRAAETIPAYETIRVRKDGTRINVSIRASAIRRADGSLAGISKISRDISATLEASQRLAAIVESSDDAIVSKDLDGTIRSWNPAAERMFGYTAGEAIGRPIFIIIPRDRHDEERTVLDRLRRGEKVDHFETVRCRKDGSCFPVSLTVSPLRSPDGEVVGASKIARDITDRRRAEERAGRANQRALFLGQMMEALSKSLDYEKTLKSIAWLAVPTLADWCAVDVVQKSGEIERLAVAHVDDRKIELAKQISRRYEDSSSPYSAPHVIRTATPVLLADITDDMIVAAAKGDQERIRLTRQLGLKSYICVPLVASGRALGALTFVAAESHRRFTDDDLRFAEDVASRAAMAVENARSFRQLDEANRLKDEFLATLSHELRTPLNAILGYARMVRSGLIAPEKMAGALETIERNSTALTQMVDDLLDVSRIVSGKMRLAVQPVEVPVILQEAVQTVMPAAEAKRIKIHTVIDPLVSPIAGDPDRLRQIVWNLLSNAIKFTPKEGNVQVRLERINSSVEIVVSDTGVGMSADLLPHIFERFRQGEGGFSRQHSGLGLGLAIVRNLVEMHGGSIYASSDGPGTGSTFRVRLPVMIVHQAPVEEKRVHSPQESKPRIDNLPDLSGTRVLAVDDEPDALRLLAQILEAAGAQVITAASGAAALERIKTTRPDVMVTDLGMPLMDGFELIARVRRSDDATVREIPAAALTAYARSEDRAKTLQSGFEMHLAKPIDPVELASAVKALSRRRSR
ncbi:MAG TPA: PAS domain S-box protein [Vicinamibacterales bacterium]|jgi:PAS domain S-box-containing protein